MSYRVSNASWMVVALLCYEVVKQCAIGIGVSEVEVMLSVSRPRTASQTHTPRLPHLWSRIQQRLCSVLDQ